jgi:hypothetical protein
MTKVKTISGMAEQLKGRFCSLGIDNTKIKNQRIAAKITETSNNYVTVYDVNSRKNRRLQYTSIISIGSGELVYHR